MNRPLITGMTPSEPGVDPAAPLDLETIQPDPNLVNPPPNTELTPTPEVSIEPVEPVPDPKDDLIQQQMAALTEMRGEISKLNARLDNPVPVPPAPPVDPPKTKEEEDKEFWDSPRDMIRKELSEAIKPMQDFITEQNQKSVVSEAKDEYQTIKAKYKLDPRFTDLFRVAEAHIDSLMANQAPVEGNMLAVLYGIRGAIALGDIPGVSLEPTPVPVDPNVPQPVAPVAPQPTPGVTSAMLPAHIRPSPPTTVPGQPPVVQRRELNENERRLARESGLTPDQYLDLQELPADKVATHQLNPQPGA